DVDPDFRVIHVLQIFAYLFFGETNRHGNSLLFGDPGIRGRGRPHVLPKVYSPSPPGRRGAGMPVAVTTRRLLRYPPRPVGSAPYNRFRFTHTPGLRIHKDVAIVLPLLSDAVRPVQRARVWPLTRMVLVWLTGLVLLSAVLVNPAAADAPRIDTATPESGA